MSILAPRIYYNQASVYHPTRNLHNSDNCRMFLDTGRIGVLALGVNWIRRYQPSFRRPESGLWDRNGVISRLAPARG